MEDSIRIGVGLNFDTIGINRFLYQLRQSTFTRESFFALFIFILFNVLNEWLGYSDDSLTLLLIFTIGIIFLIISGA